MTFQRRQRPGLRRALDRLAAGAGSSAALRAVGLTLAMFVVGYFISARWVFPAAEDPTGGSFTEVPQLRGLALEEAGSRLSELGLAVVEGPGLNHPDAAVGTVVAQSPLPGQVARPGDTVRITPSRGPETRVVPDVGGLSGAEAATLLRGMGFEVEVADGGQLGGGAAVSATRPAAGTTLRMPARVALVVSEGTPIVEVPDLRGRHVDDIGAVLEEARLQLGAISYRVDAPEAPGRVVSQSPAVGSSLRGGGFVSVVVAGTPPDSLQADLVEDTEPPAPADTTAGSGG